MAREPETLKRVEKYQNEAKQNFVKNIISLRTALHKTKEGMAAYLGELHKGTYGDWEDEYSLVLPSYGEIANIKYQLENDPKNRAKTAVLAKFSVGDFYTSIIDFEELSNQTDTADYVPFLGTYIAYYYDFSEVRVNQLEVSRLRMRHLVMHLYEKRSRTGSKELCCYVIPFKNITHAEKALTSISLKAKTCEKLDIPRELEQHFRDELGLLDNDIYHGTVLMSKNNPCVQISVSNKSQSDYVSIMFLVPGTLSVEDMYLGGLGSMNSVNRGINNHPIAQKIIISRFPLQYDETRIGKHLCVQSSNLPIDSQVEDIIRSHEALRNSDSFGLSPDDRYHLLAYRLKKLVDTYNTQLNLTGFHISKEEDNAVFHLIKHFSIKK